MAENEHVVTAAQHLALDLAHTLTRKNLVLGFGKLSRLDFEEVKEIALHH